VIVENLISANINHGKEADFLEGFTKTKDLSQKVKTSFKLLI
jgi:hypothetical protein